jgi:phosphodiesterase/alkaline phosphatase D-like protein
MYVSRLTVVVACAAILAVLVPASASARGFSLGVTAGDVSAKSAILWGHANAPGGYVLEVATDKRFRHVAKHAGVQARSGHDNTVQRVVRGLRPGTHYFYRFRKGRKLRSDVGRFTTAPAPNANATIRFAWSGDTDFQPEAGKTTPYWNNGIVFRRMAAERNQFNVHLGDTIYSDTEVPGPAGQPFPVALTVAQKWGKYKQNLGNRFLRALRGSAGFYSHWDDHEFINDFSPEEETFANPISGINETIDGRTLYKRGIRAFTDYAPVSHSTRNGIYRHVRWGKNLEVFFLDERSFRSAKASANHVCDNPQTGSPDLAPTAPATTRAVFALAVPSLAAPVSQQCLDTIRSPNRHFLGQRQVRQFERDVKRSKARFKVVINELPIQQFYALPYDRWEGYEAERQQVLKFLQKNVKNIVFLTTDVHATLVNDARLQTLEAGGPKNTGIFDYTVGPVATANFGLEIDQVAGAGNGALVRDAFLKPQPPAGVGMRCAVIDQFSYGEVKVSSRSLTITSKDQNAKPLKDCAPLTIPFKR